MEQAYIPGEVVRLTLDLGTASVILARNHPSGAAEPSRADEAITQAKAAEAQRVAQAKELANQAARKIALAAEQKKIRDAKYAARKARRK